VTTRWLGWLAAVLAMVITVALVVGELTNSGERRWWAARPLTTDTVAGLLVLLVTVLVVNQLLSRQQAGQRGHAVAVQAAMVVAQAARSARDVSSVTDGSGDRPAAGDSFRLYMTMLLMSAPVFIDNSVARRFLEQGQYLGGVMARVLAEADGRRGSAALPGGRLDEAVRQLQVTAAPLLQALRPGMRDAIQSIGQTAEDQDPQLGSRGACALCEMRDSCGDMAGRKRTGGSGRCERW
jgi:hypothetical protein